MADTPKSSPPPRPATAPTAPDPSVPVSVPVASVPPADTSKMSKDELLERMSALESRLGQLELTPNQVAESFPQDSYDMDNLRYSAMPIDEDATSKMSLEAAAKKVLDTPEKKAEFEGADPMAHAVRGPVVYVAFSNGRKLYAEV